MFEYMQMMSVVQPVGDLITTMTMMTSLLANAALAAFAWREVR